MITDDCVLKRLVSGDWAGEETIFEVEDMAYVMVKGEELAFANDKDVDEFAKIVKEMIKNLS